MFEIPASKAGTKDGQFVFKAPGGKTMRVPLQQYLNLEQSAILGTIDATRVMTGHFRDEMAEAFSAEFTDMLMKLELQQFNAFMDAWADASDITPGESEPSGD